MNKLVQINISNKASYSKNNLSMLSNESSKKVVYLTFDDGPSSDITPQILDILKKYNIKATFFVIGKNIAANKDVFSREA